VSGAFRLGKAKKQKSRYEYEPPVKHTVFNSAESYSAFLDQERVVIRTDLGVWDSEGRTARPGHPGKDRLDRTAWKGEPGKESQDTQNGTTRMGPPDRDRQNEADKTHWTGRT
jgi:hypothetical protein